MKDFTSQVTDYCDFDFGNQSCGSHTFLLSLTCWLPVLNSV